MEHVWNKIQSPAYANRSSSLSGVALDRLRHARGQPCSKVSVKHSSRPLRKVSGPWWMTSLTTNQREACAHPLSVSKIWNCSLQRSSWKSLCLFLIGVLNLCTNNLRELNLSGFTYSTVKPHCRELMRCHQLDTAVTLMDMGSLVWFFVNILILGGLIQSHPR